jgi:hypothetical protein
MPNRFAIAMVATSILAAAMLISPLTAQIRGGGVTPGTMGIGATPTSGIGTSGVGRSGAGIGTVGSDGRGFAGGPVRFHRGHASGRSAILLPYPYYYSDYGYDAEEAAPPKVVTAPAAAPAQPAPPAPPLEPLLIEWQGDHFERMTLSQKVSAGGQGGPDYSAKSAVRSSAPASSSPGSARSARKIATEPPRELPPAVLVFRDGRTEEVSSYTIMSGTIYSKTDYWASGSWTKKIQIADLDVPATLKLNHEHGLNFVLPASPNEVVMRP